jgi:hypothetical protein
VKPNFRPQQLALLVATCSALVFCSAVASEPAAEQPVPVAEPTAPASPSPTVINVPTISHLRAALQNLQPGTTILIAPGFYSRGISIANIHGTPESPIVIAAADPADPPVFSSNNEGAKLSSCSYIKLSGITFTSCGGNGINIDDGGKIDQPSHHVILEKLAILETGPKGNHDALKMSGVNHFIVRDCRFEGWGGSGIDLVGCHSGVIDGSQFIGRPGDRTKNAVQIKGGSSEILVQTSFFQNAGERVVHIGGSTGLDYFRPIDASYEGKNVIVAGNRFVGGEAQIAWVTCQHSHVHHNIFYFPGKWLGRILQETKDRRFEPSQLGLFEDNLIVTDGRVRSYVNVGFGTEPSTFAFRHNAWHRKGENKKPSLPTREIDGVYGIDPQLVDAGTPTMRISAQQPQLQSIGPDAYKPWTSAGDFADVSVPPPEWIPPPQAWGLRGKKLTYALLAVIAVAAILVKQLANWRREKKAS